VQGGLAVLAVLAEILVQQVRLGTLLLVLDLVAVK
jgi:hypothetical protein